MAANALRFATQPAGYTSEGLLTTQPVVEAYDTATGLVDTTFTGIVTLTPDKASSRFYTESDLIATTHTVQAGSTASAVLVSPALSFPATLPPDYDGRGYYCFIASSGGAVPQYQRRTIAGNTGTGQLDLATAFSAVPDTGATIKVRSGVIPSYVSATCVNGVATFSSLSLMGREATALVASSPGLTSATSTAMTPTGTRVGLAELPRVTMDTSAPVINGVVKYVGPTGDYPGTLTGLQQACDDRVNANSAAVDAIVLQAGVVIDGSVQLKKKLTQTAPIVLKGHSDPAPEGTRAQMSTFVGGNYAKVRGGAGSSYAFYCDSGAHHWRLQGFEVTVQPAVSFSGGMINLNDYPSEVAGTGTLAGMPTDIVIDRMYIHGDPVKECKFGVRLGGIRQAVVGCYIADFHGGNVLGDTQAISGYAGAGPYHIHNNYLEASGENFILGGADPYVLGTVPSDITFTKNHLFKPLSWMSDATIRNSTKNLFELKNARRVLAEGNVLENCWSGGQTGSGVQITPVNQSATAPNSGVRDVVFRRNVMRNSSSGYNVTNENSEMGVTSIGLWRFVIQDTALWNVNDPAEIQNEQRLMALLGGTEVQVTHNTLLGSVNATATRAVIFDTPENALVRSRYDDNLTTAESYAVFASGNSPGGPSITAQLLNGGGSFAKNGLVHLDANGGSGYPASTVFPANNGAVGFTTVGITSTWDTAPIDDVLAALTLASTSPYSAANGWTDSAASAVDLGANMTAVRAAVLGVVEGTPGTGGATPTQLLLSTPPAGAVSGQPLTQQPVVAVADAGGSTVTSDTSTVTAEWISLTGDATASGTLTKVATAGVATFTTLALTWTVASTGYWHFTDGALTSVDGTVMTLTVAPPPPPDDDFGIVRGDPVVFRMARGRAVFAGYRRSR